MTKQKNKKDQQRKKQQTQKPSKNRARYRERTDVVYCEANLDNVIRHQIRVGQNSEWIAVLNGGAPAIILPNGEVDRDELERCRNLVIDMHGEAAPEEPYYDEFDQYLTPKQLDNLRNTKPVIMMAYVERQFDVKLQREHSLLQNRVRDAIEFGLGQGLQYTGRLWFIRDQAWTVPATDAATFAAGLFPESWKPANENASEDEWSTYVQVLASAGNLHERAVHFMDPAKSDELIKADIRAIRGPKPTTDIERQFWQTIICGLLNCRGHDGPQASAQRQISRSVQFAKPASRADVLNFLGVTRTQTNLIDLMALAYFEMPDAHRPFPTFHFHFPDFEMLAALGALTRDKCVRIDAKTALRLGKILSHPKPSGVESSQDNPPQPLTPVQFLRHAMARVGSDAWWAHVLQSPPDNFGVRHLRKGEDLGPVPPGSDSLALNDGAAREAIARLLVPLMSRFAVRLGKFSESRFWQYLVQENIMLLNMERMAEACRNDVGLIALNLVDALAAGLHQGLGLDEFQTISPQLPGYYREMARIAAASLTVMQVIAPRLCERRELDLRYYARFLTDREYRMANLRGETTGCRILEILGYPILARKGVRSRRS